MMLILSPRLLFLKEFKFINYVLSIKLNLDIYFAQKNFISNMEYKNSLKFSKLYNLIKFKQ